MTKKITELEQEEIIDVLHKYLSRTNLLLKEEQRKVADEKMMLILKDGLIQELLEKYRNDGNKGENYFDENKALEEIEFIILKFYYAIYNDNVEIYRKFLNDKISLGPSIYENRLYLLNKELTNIFKNDKEYFEFIRVFNPSIQRFYTSIGNKDTKERDEYIDAFVNIIKKDKRYLFRKKNDQPQIYLDLLTGRNIKVFGEDFLKNATYKQKEIINSFNYKMSDENLEKIKFLIKKYPNYQLVCSLNEKFIESFTIDEIGNMPPNQTMILNKAAQEGIISQALEIFKIKPDFNCPEKMVNEMAFSEIPADTLVLLSDSAKRDISKITKKEGYRKSVNKIINKDLNNLREVIKKKLNARKEKKAKEKPARKK